MSYRATKAGIIALYVVMNVGFAAWMLGRGHLERLPVFLGLLAAGSAFTGWGALFFVRSARAWR